MGHTSFSMPRFRALVSSRGTNTHLVVIGDAAVGRGGSDLWCGSSEVTGGHDARLSNTQTQDQVVTPQRDVIVTGACCAGFLSIDWTAAESQKESGQVNLS